MQIALVNTAETDEPQDYGLDIDQSSNPDGLRVFVAGQALTDEIVFHGLPSGENQVTIEVYRGPIKFTYEPFTVRFYSLCDDAISTEITLSVDYLTPCPAATFALADMGGYLMTDKS